MMWEAQYAMAAHAHLPSIWEMGTGGSVQSYPSLHNEVQASLRCMEYSSDFFSSLSMIAY